MRRAAGVVSTLIGHTADIYGVEFSPDGRRLATASSDRTIKLWDTATGLEVFTLRGHTAGLMCVAFGPDGRRLASGGFDRTVRIWDATPLPAEILAEHEALFRQKLATFEQLRHAGNPAAEGERLARLGRWPRAAAAFAKAVEQDSENPLSDLPLFPVPPGGRGPERLSPRGGGCARPVRHHDRFESRQ